MIGQLASLQLFVLRLTHTTYMALQKVQHWFQLHGKLATSKIPKIHLHMCRQNGRMINET
ncbi:hypothetical protein AAHE18_20G236500 [Arachis hypogaea]